MHNLPQTLMTPFAELVAREARSALPDAPVQPEPTPVHRVARTRRALAVTLHRAADVVSPA
jgi:hypothetical protein